MEIVHVWKLKRCGREGDSNRNDAAATSFQCTRYAESSFSIPPVH